MTRHRRPPFGRLLLALVVAALLAACSSSPAATNAGSGSPVAGPSTDATASGPPRASRPATTAPPATATTTRSPAAAPTAPRTPSPGPLPCTTAQLRVTLGPPDGAAGSVYEPLRFQNRSRTTCTLSGHPGVSYVAGPDGHQVGSPASRTGNPVHVLLRPGAIASAVLQTLHAENEDPARCRPTKVAGLRVYPPDQRASVFLRRAATGCAGADVRLLGIGPVRPGTTGD